MKHKGTAIALALAAILPAMARADLADLVVTDTPIQTLPMNARTARRFATGDTASLLGSQPGVSLYGGGGVSSLPAIHGLADDRVKVDVDGMSLISACANHMNPPLSYIDPSSVARLQIFAGITPVSIGGDSIGGTIKADSAPPQFAAPGQDKLLKGEAGALYRSNGNARGGHVAATLAGDAFSLNYAGSTVEAGNYRAGGNFKPAGVSSGTLTQVWLAGDEVGSSAYKSENQSLALAWRNENQLLELRISQQHIPYQGFPDQRMDMTANDSHQVNLHYTGRHDWGTLEARAWQEKTRHAMNFLEDKSTSIAGMPMDTRGSNTGGLLKADITLSERDILRVGSEVQRYRLDDWWDPVSASVGMMSPNTFWNIDGGRRDRFDVFTEWEARWNPAWLSQVGVRNSRVSMDTGTVQGYNSMMYGNPTNPASIPGAFNASDRKKTDNNIDLTALFRYTPGEEASYEFGFARKTRSPNLYERFAWSTNNTMVMQMINWSGDANGYVGNPDLKPETANTVSGTANWHDGAQERWELKLTPYYTRVENYIDAVRCPLAAGTACTAANQAATTGFVYLQFANQSARLYGADLSGFLFLGKWAGYGRLTASGVLSYVDGRNTSTGDNLYNIMPLNTRLALVQQLGSWSNTLETQLVDAKTHVSRVRDEQTTGGYGLLNLRSSYDWQQARLDFSIENLLDRNYALPLGGAYVGQRPMTYGTPVPGMGRSVNLALTVRF